MSETTNPTWTLIERRATALRERQPELTTEQAFVRVLEAEPGLYTRLRADEAAATPATPEPNPILGLYIQKLAHEARGADPTLTEAQAFVAAIDLLSPALRAELVADRRRATG